jgi:mono/diheme cytochrome c family protein
MSNRIAPLFVVLCCIALPEIARAADAERGKLLYESRCDGCHAESLPGRKAKTAADFESIRTYVKRWNTSLGGAWGEEDITDVTVYLNAKYYFYVCPPSVCKKTATNGAELAFLSAKLQR